MMCPEQCVFNLILCKREGAGVGKEGEREKNKVWISQSGYNMVKNIN